VREGALGDWEEPKERVRSNDRWLAKTDKKPHVKRGRGSSFSSIREFRRGMISGCPRGGEGLWALEGRGLLPGYHLKETMVVVQ